MLLLTTIGASSGARLFAKVVAGMPGFGEYQAKIQRQIPVVVLTRQK